MEDNYMTDGGEAPMPTAQPEPKDEARKSERTALLPISFFEGKELTPGTECKIKVQGVQEDQVEVAYVPHSEAEEMPEEVVEAPEEDLMA